MVQTTNKYNFIDLTKFICALLVMIIHVPFMNSINGNFFNDFWYYLKNSICRIAVPLFFTYSGYFLYKKIDLNNFSFKPIFKYLGHILLLYVIYTLIYMLADIQNIFNNPLVIFEYIKRALLITYKTHLWYLHGLIVAVLLVSFLLFVKVKPKVVLIISSVFLLLGVIGNGYYGLIENCSDIWIISKYYETFETTRNGLFFGFFFVALGLNFKDYKCKLNHKYLLILFILSSVLLVCEAIILSKYIFQEGYDILIFLVPTVIFCFLLTSSITLKGMRRYIYLRKLSTLIYLIHPMIFGLINFILGEVSISPYLFYLISIVVLLPLCYLIIKLSEKKAFSFLKKLY